ncbi:MAG: sigma-70 family RNA polymerase sigma factor [Oscillospiraceae bacterium]|nr:sigma-70 family RNA polymerase sigma factor [Oscillospiraceae bacterium]
MNDTDIIDLFCRRSESAVSQIEQKYGNLCRHVAKGVLSNNEDIDECVNDALFAVWNAIPPEKPEKLSAFICKITRNIALDKFDYITSKRRNPNMKVSMTELEDCLFQSNDVNSTVENREIISHVNAFLRRLSFDDRNVFLRKYFFGDSLAEIGKTFKFSESKVKSSLHRTRNKLKTYLIKKGVEF